jgi:hypothetical protein
MARDARVLDLHGDGLPGFEPCPVDLPEGRRGHRPRLEGGERVLGLAAELVAEVLPQEREVHRG